MLTFQTEMVADVQEIVQKLAKAHWDEVEASLYGQQEYALSIATYTTLESMGLLHVSTMRDTEGVLCGYAVFILSSCHHKQHILGASLDAFYLAPTARQGLNAVSFLREAEKALKARGVQQVQYTSPTSRPCDALYKRLGAKHTENLFYKSL